MVVLALNDDLGEAASLRNIWECRKAKAKLPTIRRSSRGMPVAVQSVQCDFLSAGSSVSWFCLKEEGRP